MMSNSLNSSRALSLESRVLNFLIFTNGFIALIFSAAESSLGRPTSAVVVDDLALEICVIHNVEVNNAERAHAGCAEIKRERRAKASGADAENFRGFDLELALHADLGHDEVARVAQDLVVGEGDGGDFG